MDPERFIQIFKIKKNSHKYYEGIGKLKFSHPKHEFSQEHLFLIRQCGGLDEIKKEKIIFHLEHILNMVFILVILYCQCKRVT